MLNKLAKKYTPAQIIEAWKNWLFEIVVDIDEVIATKKTDYERAYYILKILRKHKQSMKFS